MATELKKKYLEEDEVSLLRMFWVGLCIEEAGAGWLGRVWGSRSNHRTALEPALPDSLLDLRRVVTCSLLSLTIV